jgi:tetratricopeptide (TPR) repeat protein
VIVPLLLASIFSIFSPARRDARAGARAYREGRLPEASRLFGEARRRDPADRAWAYDLGTALAAAGNDDAREKLLEAAHGPDRAVAADALYQQGTFDLSRGETHRAVEELRASLLLDPARADAKRNFEIALQRNRKPPPSPPKPDSSPSPKNGSKSLPQDAPAGEPEFQKRAGMTRPEAEALLRSLDLEQRQREKPSASTKGKDW